MAPLENYLRDRKAIKELFCGAQFEKLSQEDEEKFRILNKFHTSHQDGGEPREKRTSRGGLPLNQGAPTADQNVRCWKLSIRSRWRRDGILQATKYRNGSDL